MAEIRFGEFEVDVAAELLRRDGEILHLEPRIFHLLVYLLEHRDRLVTKEDLNQHVWSGAFVTDNAVDRAVARLRKALGDDVHAPRFIETVPTRGYRFVAQVETVERPAPAPAAVTIPAGPTPIAPARAARAQLRRTLRLFVLLLCTVPVAGVLLIALRSRDAPVARRGHTDSDRVVARQVTTSEVFEFAPSFSPDGASLAYTANRGKESSVWVRSLAPGGRERELAETAGARVAAWSPDGRLIAYDSYQGIWVVPATGGSPRQVVPRGGSPKWSPDASTLVYQSSMEGVDINSWPARPPSTLWSVTLDGAVTRQLTRQDVPPGGHGQPSFSPDGRRIVFVTSSFGEPGEIWTMAADGSDLRRVRADCQCRDAIFSRDGRSLYYDDFVDSQHGLWEISVAGESPPRRLYEAPLRFLALAPDGRRLAASRHQLDSDLWSIEVSRETAQPVGEPAPFTLQNVDRNQFPVSSPDGQRIVFIVTRAGNIRELWMVPAAGGHAEMLAAGSLGGWPAWSDDSRQIYFINGDRLERIDLSTRRVETMFQTDLDWQTPAAAAPGGGRVAFTLVDEAGVSNVWTIDTSGQKRQITRETHFASYPIWSPDGRFIAVEFRTKDGTHVGYVDALGGEVIPLTEGREECYTGGWSPDGDKIVFPRRPIEGPMEHWDLWWVSRSTGEQRQLTDRPIHPGREFLRYPTWSASGDRILFELAQSTADLWLLELPGSP